MLSVSYVDAVVDAGGIPVVVPPPVGEPAGAGGNPGFDAGAWAAGVLAACDGLVMTGGGDVDPARYGGPEATPAAGVLVVRDEAELALAGAAVDRGLPLLAICRGLQVLNVALGGDLVAHVPDVVSSDAHRPAPGAFGSVLVHTVAGSLARRLLGPSASVPCSHHQAVGRLGDGLVATAWADDGLVEAVEHSGDGFVMGVQWHPEERDGAGLFRALVERAKMTMEAEVGMEAT